MHLARAACTGPCRSRLPTGAGIMMGPSPPLPAPLPLPAPAPPSAELAEGRGRGRYRGGAAHGAVRRREHRRQIYQARQPPPPRGGALKAPFNFNCEAAACQKATVTCDNRRSSTRQMWRTTSTVQGWITVR
eukprot:gene17067-biopygen23316